MSYRQGYSELEGRFTTVVGDTFSGSTISAGNEEVGAAEIASGAITLAHLAVDSISGNRIVDQGIAAGKILNAALTITQLAANAVSGTIISDQGIGAGKILNAAITATQLANNAVSGLKISPEYGPVGTGSPVAYGRSTLFGAGTTDGASGLWVVFGRGFAANPVVVASSTIASTVVISAPGSLNAGSFFAVSEGASRTFNWMAICSTTI